MSNLVLEGESYYNFINSLRSEDTKTDYRNALVRFTRHFSINDISSLSPKEIESCLKEYIVYLKEQGRSRSSMNIITAALSHYCTMNDININFRRLNKFKSDEKKTSDLAYTHEQIKKVLDISPLRVKVILLIYASTGIRKTALVELKLKDVNKVGNIFEFTIYKGEKEEYKTYCTPECASFIDKYLEFRRRCGEIFTDLTPLVRQEFDINDLGKIRRPIKLTSHTVANTILNYLVKAGLREVNHMEQFNRKSIKLIHGFRKFFETQLINSQVNPAVVSKLMGHGDRNNLTLLYYKPSSDFLVSEYEKAIDLLTIDVANRLQKKIDKLEIEKTQFEALQRRLKPLRIK